MGPRLAVPGHNSVTQLHPAHHGWHCRVAALFGRLPELGNTLISHRYELEQATAAFDTAAERAAGALKVVVDVS